MKYLCDLDIENAICVDADRFIISIKNGGKVLVDGIGRVLTAELKDIVRRDDGFYQGECFINNVKCLFDSDAVLFIDACLKISEFSPEDIAVVENVDHSKNWITKGMKRYGYDYADIGEFAYGFAPFLDNGGKCGFVNKNFKEVATGFDRVSPFVYGYAYVSKDGREYYVNKKFKEVKDPFENIVSVKEGEDIEVTTFSDDYVYNQVYPLKLKNIIKTSRNAKQIEANPISVVLVETRYTDAPKTLLNLYLHAINVIESFNTTTKIGEEPSYGAFGRDLQVLLRNYKSLKQKLEADKTLQPD